MNFIIAPLVCLIVFSFLYGIFELFIRRRERIDIIEKIGDKLDASHLQNNINLPSLGGKNFSFGALKGGCLLIGIGLGLFVGLAINIAIIEFGIKLHNQHIHDLVGIAYGAPVLIFGGLGLLIAFIVETKMNKKKD